MYAHIYTKKMTVEIYMKFWLVVSRWWDYTNFLFFTSLCFSEEFDSFVISMNSFYIRTPKKSIPFWGKMSSKRRSIFWKQWRITCSTGIQLSPRHNSETPDGEGFPTWFLAGGDREAGSPQEDGEATKKDGRVTRNPAQGDRPHVALCTPSPTPVEPDWSWGLYSHQLLLHHLPPARNQIKCLLLQKPSHPPQPIAISSKCVCSFSSWHK